MNNKINLSQLADLLAQAGGMSKTASEQFVKNFFEIISQNVLSDGLVKVKGFGTFKIVQLEDRESVNVNTGERFTIEGHQKISFVPDSELKERINKPFSAFETMEITAEQADELARIDDVNVPDVKPDEPVIPEKPSEPEDDNDTDNVPVVKDVTQKKCTRVILKLLVWIISILLVLVLAAYLLWPLMGNSVLEFMERKVKQNNTEMVADSARTTSPKVDEAVKPAAEPAAEPASKPAAEPAKPAAKPAVEPAKPAARAFALTSGDEAKDLAEFTAADTVNYIIDGQMTVHVLQKGETITALALQYYGSKKLWPYIMKYNNIKNAGTLKPGARIRIPVLKNK